MLSLIENNNSECVQTVLTQTNPRSTDMIRRGKREIERNAWRHVERALLVQCQYV